MSLLFQERTRPHQFLSAILWTLAVVVVLSAGGLAALTVLMALSLDFGETVTAGAEPWLAALVAVAEFVGIALACVAGMAAWHTRRYKPAALALIVAAALLTLCLGWRFVGEYT